jgi:hypothetical protein
MRRCMRVNNTMKIKWFIIIVIICFFAGCVESGNSLEVSMRSDTERIPIFSESFDEDYVFETIPLDTIKILYDHCPDKWWNEFAGLEEDGEIVEWYNYTNISGKANRLDELFFILTEVFPYAVRESDDDPIKDRIQVSLCAYDLSAEHGYRKILGFDDQTYPVVLEYLREKVED